QWKLPAGVVSNLAKSTISYTVDTVAQGAGLYTFLADDCFSIANQLTLVTSTGIPIADVQFANRYSKCVDKYYTRHEDFASRGMVDLSYPCNSAVTANPIPQIPSAVLTSNCFGLPVGAPINNGIMPYREPQYYFVNPTANTTSQICKYIKLGHAGRNTLFEQDKDLYFGDSMYLNLQTAPVATMGFSSTSNTAVAGALALTGAVTVSNILLNLAVEDNAVLAESVKAKFNSPEGITLRTDFLLNLKNAISAVNANVMVQVPQQSNTHLKRIINCFYNATESTNTMYDAQNLNGNKVLNFQTTMDSQPLQYIRLSSAFSVAGAVAQTDYRDNERFIKGSVIQSVPTYSVNFAHIDDFSGDDSIMNNDIEANKEYGLDLNVSRNYLLSLNCPNAVGTPLSQYSFCVLSRTLHMSKNGIMFI
ncbi:MAG: hypothetical protein P4M14_11605, partial [Gammaproteobacteria bacterium]|nr:hypothetical protein [Gammaproteobacteria bacterium]